MIENAAARATGHEERRQRRVGAKATPRGSNRTIVRPLCLAALLPALLCSWVSSGCSCDGADKLDARNMVGPFDGPVAEAPHLDRGLSGCDGPTNGSFPSHDYQCADKTGCVALSIAYCECSCALCEHGKCVQVICDDSCMAPSCDSHVLGQACSAALPCPHAVYDCVSTATGGICACSCSPDDPSTQLINEDNCPDKATCSAFPTDAGAMYYCIADAGAPRRGPAADDALDHR